MFSNRRTRKRACQWVRLGGLIIGALAWTSFVERTSASVIYVDDNAAPGGNGQSWATAFRFLTNALTLANTPNSGVTEIRVAQGTYRPDQSNSSPAGTGDRDATFMVNTSAPVKGGYAGVGAPDPDVRDIRLQPTVLTGDLLGNDQPGGVNRNDNSRHIVRVNLASVTAILDGLIVRRGNAKGDQALPPGGGGLLLQQGLAAINGCVFEDHDAGAGGAIYNQGTEVKIDDSRFTGNRVTDAGGALSGGESRYLLTGCLFEDNISTSNAGAANLPGTAPSGSVMVADCVFRNNVAANLGGGLRCSRGEYRSCVFQENAAGSGGGCEFADTNFDDSVIEDCQFIDNIAGPGVGGGLNYRGVVAIRRCLFQSNSAGLSGGGLFRSGNIPPGITLLAPIEDCDFIDNSSAWLGGGASTFLSHIDRCRFFGDTAINSGGGIWLDGPYALTNSLFSGNSTMQDGGGASVTSNALSEIRNCTFAQNHSSQAGAGLAVFGASLSVRSNIIWNNSSGAATGMAAQYSGPSQSSAFSHNCVQDLAAASGGYFSIADDPLFVDPDGADDIAGTADDDLHLSSGTPCADGGQWPYAFALDALDVEGRPRVQNCRADMGAHESAFFADCDRNRLPDACEITGGAMPDCNNNGIPDVCEADCDRNGIPDECDLANGAPDCNGNDMLDSCDIALGVSLDCDLNGQPDECQADCNNNDVPDACDIAAGTSLDLNSNGVPDECDPDCNMNGVPDFIEIANGAQADCNNNQRPDVCDIALLGLADCNNNGLIDSCEIAELLTPDCDGDGVPDSCDVVNAPLFTYQLDDGSPESVVGRPGGGGFIWLNQFQVVAGGQTIRSINVTFAFPPIGTPSDVCLWLDPNNDGNPNDAQLLVQAPIVVSTPGALPGAVIAIPPTFIGPVGQKFFAGAHIVLPPNKSAAVIDATAPHQNKSWYSYGSNVVNLSANELAPVQTGSFGTLKGDWFIRARSGSANDANGNSVPEICESCLADVAPLPAGNGVVDVDDLFAVINAWGACLHAGNCPQDVAPVGGDDVVDVDDLFAVINAWGSCP